MAIPSDIQVNIITHLVKLLLCQLLLNFYMCLENLSKTLLDLNGQMIPINQFVIDQNKAFGIAKSGNLYIPYFVVYGKIGSVRKLDKVMFINFDQQDGLKPFVAYIFSGHYKY
ncbi:hypothetical protein SAMN05660649_04790 [Desulfotomaculum arcticum]|uniref:Uncharacterized protein n=1 Tax=Desulfotruncus arcticus DSM 17038 TaxID=1121424 RepID=A0A1I2Z7V1_9FIRM|nr:hypothetical protein SAMN05660649_04790 [Desulfotomaculum arcticum] [Desulfotruncus arcticus DSM 17038]